MSKFAEIIGEARKPVVQKAGKPENQKTRKPEDSKVGKDVLVNITIKVAESRRNHWAAEAKRKRKTLTEVITKALAKEFGEPNE